MTLLRRLARYFIEWCILVLSFVLHAVWFMFDAAVAFVYWRLDLVDAPWPLFNPEARAMFRNNLGLDTNDADGRPQDGVRESLLRIFKPGELLRKRFTHDVKNLAFEWAKADVKRAVRVLAFIALLGWLI